MLRTWIIQSDLGATPLTRAMSKGTPQVNTISPLFWLTMMKEILRILNRSGADGLVIFVSRMHTYGRNFGKGAPVCFKIQTRNQSKKKELMLFTTNTTNSTANGKCVHVILDFNSNWRLNIEPKFAKAYIVFYACKSLCHRNGIT